MGEGITDAAPGSVQGLHLVLLDIEAARTELAERGLDAGKVQNFAWGRFLFFSDPDCNRWAERKIPAREWTQWTKTRTCGGPKETALELSE